MNNNFNAQSPITIAIRNQEMAQRQGRLLLRSMMAGAALTAHLEVLDESEIIPCTAEITEIAGEWGMVELLITLSRDDAEERAHTYIERFSINRGKFQSARLDRAADEMVTRTLEHVARRFAPAARQLRVLTVTLENVPREGRAALTLSRDLT